ncbi:DUF3784 domain-containing protein [Exiguobacterium algae]|uniref:DUF3784 domain-containing protein n=1 Tax=Exiguobacterium algae TaxID=2751250 RepID=UPI001BEB714A|nr:DUF3784 domain-containing protein [Exiguobacterium algae]
MWILAIVALFLFLLGFAVDRLGWHRLISGYHTMTKEEKERVDFKKVARLVAWMCYGIGLTFLLIVAIDVYQLNLPLEPVFVVLFVFIVAMMWRMQRYDGNIYDEDGRIRPGGKKRLIPVVLVSLLLLVGVPALFLWFSQPTEVTVTVDTFTIEGAYGREVPIDDITNVSLTTLPDMKRRTNGAATSTRLTGHFKSEDDEDVLLFVDRSVDEVIRIDWTDKPIYMNLATTDETVQLYETLANQQK